MLNQKGKEIMQ